MIAYKDNIEKEFILIQSYPDNNPSNINVERFNTAEKN